MSAVPFGTLKLADKLQAGGFSVEQAKAAATASAEVLGEQVATKTDMQALRSELKEVELRLTIKLGGMIVVATGVLLAAKFFA